MIAPPQPLHEFVTLRELADALAVTTQTVRNWQRRGLFPAPSIPSKKKPRWRRSDIADFFDRVRGAGGAANV
jgi:hypothetical protein